MRVDRRSLGTRVRVILNRTEVRRATEAVLAERATPPARIDRGTKICVSKIGHGSSDIMVGPMELERKCREVAATQIIVPGHADFRVSLDNEGGLVSATFQWHEEDAIQCQTSKQLSKP